VRHVLGEALALKAERRDAVPIAGGTDLMVELNFDRRRPDALRDLKGVPELAGWERVNGSIRIGAGVTFTRIIMELGQLVPGLAIAGWPAWHGLTGGGRLAASGQRRRNGRERIDAG
jgi:CO/xanthine dehydrogenase FAD-binding subunit